MWSDAIEFKIDTGADLTAISDAAFRTLRGSKLKSPKITLYGHAHTCTGTSLNVIGQLEGELSHQGKTTSQQPASVCGERSKNKPTGSASYSRTGPGGKGGGN